MYCKNSVNRKKKTNKNKQTILRKEIKYYCSIRNELSTWKAKPNFKLIE